MLSVEKGNEVRADSSKADATTTQPARLPDIGEQLVCIIETPPRRQTMLNDFDCFRVKHSRSLS